MAAQLSSLFVAYSDISVMQTHCQSRRNTSVSPMTPVAHLEQRVRKRIL
jgi:hypothetical protein